jgi:hypothetical protein
VLPKLFWIAGAQGAAASSRKIEPDRETSTAATSPSKSFAIVVGPVPICLRKARQGKIAPVIGLDQLQSLINAGGHSR